MLIFLLKRIIQSFIVLLVMSLVVFAAVYAIGNPIDVLINPNASEAQKLKTIKNLGLDKSLFEQYFIFIKNASNGEFGHSFVHNRPAITLILERLPATLELTFFAMLIAILLGIPLGLLAGLYPNNFLGKSILSSSILFFSLPTFWVGLMLILIFAVSFNIFPSTGRGETIDVLGFDFSFLTIDGLHHIFLPALNLSLYPLALIIRLTYVLIAFAVITESIFAWPGMGRLIIESITLLDRPVIVAYLLVTVFIFMIVNLLVDILYSILDPRVRITDV